jgi:hypothetical protein
MAHFAEIDQSNTVVRVVVVPDDQEHRGQEFLANDLNLGGTWIQTSYNNKIRKNYAGIGMIYDTTLDAFIDPQPYPSWILDTETCKWNPPKEKPSSDGLYQWNEEKLDWDIIDV